MHEMTQEEFITQIEQNQGILHKVCGMFCQREHDKEDLYQEIILQLWKSWSNFEGKSKISTWMYRVALNTAISMSAKNKKHQPSLIEHPPLRQGISDEDESVTEEDIQLLYSAIARLSEIERAVILLYLEEKTYEEISEITGLTKSNVGVRILRIKQKLEVEMKKTMHNERQ